MLHNPPSPVSAFHNNNYYLQPSFYPKQTHHLSNLNSYPIQQVFLHDVLPKVSIQIPSSSELEIPPSQRELHSNNFNNTSFNNVNNNNNQIHSLHFHPLLPASRPQPEFKKELVMFIPENENYSIIYPNWWKKLEPFEGQVLFISPRINAFQFCENISVIPEDLSFSPHLQDLNAYTFHTLSNLYLEPGSTILHSGNTQLAGYLAHEVIYSGISNGSPIFFKQTWIIVNCKAYILTFTCEASKFSQCLPLAQQLMNSFRIIPPSFKENL